VLEESYDWHLKKDQGMTLHWTCRVKIANSQLTDWNEISLPARSGRLTQVHAQLLHKNGHEETISPVHIQVEGSPTAKLHGFETDGTLILPGLVHHCILQISVKMAWTSWRDQKIFLYTHSPRDRLRVSVSSAPFSSIAKDALHQLTPPYWENRQFDGPTEHQPTFQVETSNKRITWEWNHLPAFEGERLAPPISALGGILNLPFEHILETDQREGALKGQFSRLTELVDAYSIPMNLDLMRLGRKISKESPSREAYLRSSFNFVALHVRNMQDLSLVKQNRGNVLKDLYGHSYQKVNLLRGLLRTKGISNQLAFYHQAALGMQRPIDMSAITMHPLLVVDLMGRRYFLAPYLENSQFDVLPTELQGAFVLLLDSETQEPEIIRIPFPEPVIIEESIYIEVLKVDTFRVTTDLTLSGDVLESFRFQQIRHPKSWLHTLVREKLQTSWPQFKIESVVFKPEKEAHLRVTFSVTQPTSQGSRLRSLNYLEDFCLFPPPKKSPLRTKRKWPIQTLRNQTWKTSWEVESIHEVNLARAFKEAIRINNEFGSLRFEDRKKGDGFTTMRQVTLHPFEKTGIKPQHIEQINAIYSQLEPGNFLAISTPTKGPN